MPTRFTKVKIPARSRPALMDLIMDACEKLPREELARFLMGYFTTVDLDMILRDIIERKELAGSE